MKNPNERVFNELAIILLDTLQVEGSAERVTYAALALQNAYDAGQQAGLDLAEAALWLASADLAETLPAPSSCDCGAMSLQQHHAGDGRPLCLPSCSSNGVKLEDHPSPRDAMQAAGWGGSPATSRWVEPDPELAPRIDD